LPRRRNCLPYNWAPDTGTGTRRSTQAWSLASDDVVHRPPVSKTPLREEETPAMTRRAVGFLRRNSCSTWLNLHHLRSHD